MENKTLDEVYNSFMDDDINEASGYGGSDLLWSIIGDGKVSKGQKIFTSTRDKLGTDEQSIKLLTTVIRMIAKSLDITENERTALNYIRTGMKNATNDPASARNSIFKVAHALKIKLPSSAF